MKPLRRCALAGGLDKPPRRPASGRGLALAAGLYLCACAGAPQAPEVRHHLSGQEFPLEAFRGHVLLLNFWATWCKPCLSEVPQLAKTAVEYGDQVVFVALYYQSQLASGAQVTDWLRFQPDYFSHYVAWGNGPLHQQFPHRLLPTTYVVGRAGTVVKKLEGSITGEARIAELRASIEAGLHQAWPVPGGAPAAAPAGTGPPSP